MKKIISIIFLITFLIQPSYALDINKFFNLKISNADERAVRKVLNSQIRHANKNNFKKFISTFDPQYKNADGFNLDVYSTLIKDIWETYDDIKYSIDIKKIAVDEKDAIAEIKEFSTANIVFHGNYDGILTSEADTIYYFKKNNDGKWKVVSDKVLDETTTMLYGEAKNLNIKLCVPNPISANTDYTATLEFIPPKETIAIASLASDIVEYPQKPTEEIFRALPEDNILERIFTSNNQNANEYVIASIGLTKTSIKDLNLRLSLTGFGYTIKRVNVISEGKDIEQ